MDSQLIQWATRHGVSLAALQDLQHVLGTLTPDLPDAAPASGKSESYVGSLLLLEASRKGVRLWRNNVGALQDKTGRVVRYGLANETAALNKVLKSSDYIGWRPVTVNGHKVAQVVAREAKHPGWQYTGAGREPAQKVWIDMVNAAGGDAAFCTGEGSL